MSTEKSDTTEFNLEDAMVIWKAQQTLTPASKELYSICQCCGTVAPETSAYKSLIADGYNKYKKVIHYTFRKEGQKPRPITRENSLLIKDESGSTVLLEWGGNKK